MEDWRLIDRNSRISSGRILFLYLLHMQKSLNVQFMMMCSRDTEVLAFKPLKVLLLTP